MMGENKPLPKYSLCDSLATTRSIGSFEHPSKPARISAIGMIAFIATRSSAKPRMKIELNQCYWIFKAGNVKLTWPRGQLASEQSIRIFSGTAKRLRLRERLRLRGGRKDESYLLRPLVLCGARRAQNFVVRSVH